MKWKRERKIGERFSSEKGTFEVREGKCVDGCFLWTGKYNLLDLCRGNAFDHQFCGNCSKVFRKDKKSVIFVKVEE